MAQSRTPTRPADDDTVLIPVVGAKRRSLAATLALIGGAIVGLAVVAGIIASVLTMSGESNRPVAPEAPLTPISAPAHSAATTPPSSPSAVSPEPTESFAPLPPITATAQTLAPQGPDGGRLRDRLHQLFPRLFPGNP